MKSFFNTKNIHGFALIEALIAMIVASFGMLALAGFQNTLSLNADVAKQRTEATRLAQQKLEQLRTFDTLTVYGTQMVSGSDTIQTNASFARSWGVSALASPDTGRSINVTVSWTDRAGNAQDVKLLSHVSASDPALAGSVFFSSSSTGNVRKPMNRSINIPYPAVSIQGGRSAFQPDGSTVVIVFDNATGKVQGKCTNASLPATNGTVDLNGTGCDSNVGYLLSGYIRFCTSNNCGGSNNQQDPGSEYANAADATQALDSTNPLQLDTSNQTGGTPTLSCYSSRRVILKSNNTNTADTGQANNQVTARFISYACIVYPVDHDSNDTATPRRWWGRVTLNPSGWTIGSSSSNRKVCRFTADFNSNSSMSNNEHPLWYRGVTDALDNQNYLVIPGNDNCPTDGPTDPASSDFVNGNTATHQTSGSSLTGAVLSFTCTTSACTGGGKVVIEPSTLSTDLPNQ